VKQVIIDLLCPFNDKKIYLPMTKANKFIEHIAIAQDLNAHAWYAHLQVASERGTNGKSYGRSGNTFL